MPKMVIVHLETNQMEGTDQEVLEKAIALFGHFLLYGNVSPQVGKQIRVGLSAEFEIKDLSGE